jgi:hypothetical protein
MIRNDQTTSRFGSCVFALFLGASLAVSAPANASKVGVAAAVNPDAFSSLSGVPNKQLNIGKSIFYNERIKTSAQGLVQVLLVDGSTFTVGPNSNLTIDRFVYDPNKKTGEIVATFSKGSMRFIGGKLSKNEGGVKVNTPSGVLAIRGGMFQGSTQKKVYSFLFGHSMTMQGRNGQTQTVYQPGYTLDLSNGRGTVRPTTAEDTNFFMQALSSPATTTASTNGGGNSGTSNPNSVAQQSGQQAANIANAASQAISDATFAQIQTDIDRQYIRLEEYVTPPANTPAPTITQSPTNTPEPEPEPIQSPTNTPEPEPEPIKIELRVLTPPSNYTAYGEQIKDPEDRGVLGGDDNPEVTSDDFIWTFTIEDGRVVGTVTGLTGGISGDPESTEQLDPADVDFPAVFPLTDCMEGICAVKDAKVTYDDQTKTYQGYAVLRQDFYAFHITDPEAGLGFELGEANDLNVAQEEDGGPPRTVLAFGGKGYDFGAARGRTFAFLLTPDVTSNALAPFAGDGSAPTFDTSQDENGNYINPQPFVTPLLFKEQTNGTPESEAVWLQTSLYISTTPKDEDSKTGLTQDSFINIALGGINPVSGGLVGERRGGSHFATASYYKEPKLIPCNDGVCWDNANTNANSNAPDTSKLTEGYIFTGAIASLSGPDGSHFLGTDEPNLVIGFDSTGDRHNIGQDTSYDTQNELMGSTNHIALGVGTLPEQPQSFDGTFKGYAAGMIESEIPVQGFTNIAASERPGDFKIGFDQDTNTLWADITVFDQGNDVVDSYQLKLGTPNGSSLQNRSAYIDDLHYGAIETGSGDVVTNFGTANAASYIVSGDQIGVTKFFPETFEQVNNGDDGPYRPFCTDCDFIKWGAWGTRVAFGGDPDNPTYVDNVHLGWWVAGDMTSIASLDALAAQGAEATYSGNAIGTVANKINSNTWSTYTAAGKLDMGWEFAKRSGEFSITKFDRANFPRTGGLSFRGEMKAPGVLDNGISTDNSNSFSGPIAGNLPGNLGSLSGAARGSFVNDSIGNPARGVIGNWNIGGQDYKAGGIFAGSGRPIIPGGPN